MNQNKYIYKQSKKYLIISILIAIVIHFIGLIFTFERTYDAFVHIFFADHYVRSWVEPWEPRWYTGFLMVSYPPLAHQTMALISFILGLKMSFVVMSTLSSVLFITGMYRFSRIISQNPMAGGYTVLYASVSSIIMETLHVFGQLPTLLGISFLLHTLPQIYLWIRFGKRYNLFLSLLIFAVTVTSHHVTVIFGMVFFILPIIGLSLIDTILESGNKISIITFWQEFKLKFKRIIVFGLFAVISIIWVILPYWIWSQSDPINQIPIPHGSRENFILNSILGLVFFLIPWGVMILMIGYFIYRLYSKRLFFFGVSFSILFLLGTGGTTPIPKLLLGSNAYNILTLERFTFWAVIIAMPLFGEFLYRFFQGDFREWFIRQWGYKLYRISQGIWIASILGLTIFTLTLSQMRSLQPANLNIKPIVNFLSQDKHYEWRYITLGFGDQMAWLSANTNAYSIDGNYHSVRRIPELTTRPIERLENSKFRGEKGLETLQDFLTNAEKFHLKYVFSNDKFYDPLLFFTGWQKVVQLENNVVVWERPQVTRLPSEIPFINLPQYQKIHWAFVPVTLIIILIIFYLQSKIIKYIYPLNFPSIKSLKIKSKFHSISTIKLKWIFGIAFILMISVSLFTSYQLYSNIEQSTPQNSLLSYYDAMDFKDYNDAYSLYESSENYSKDQFLLEILTKDGLLNSYGKMNSINFKVLSQTKNNAKVKANSQWQTPLMPIELNKIHYLHKIKNKWYLIPDKYNTDIPEEQFFSTNTVNYFNHGKRKTNVREDFFSDALDNPSLEIKEYHIVKRDSNYFIIGRLQNTSNFPSNIILRALIYDKNNQLVSSHSTEKEIKYLLLPREETSFLLPLRHINYIDQYDINLFISSEVSYRGKYNPISIQKIELMDSNLTIELFNYGIKEITIPQILISHYNPNGEIVWLQSFYGLHSIKPHKRDREEIELDKLTSTITNKKLKTLTINNVNIPILNVSKAQNLIVDTLHSEYISLDINPFIGND